MNSHAPRAFFAPAGMTMKLPLDQPARARPPCAGGGIGAVTYLTSGANRLSCTTRHWPSAVIAYLPVMNGQSAPKVVLSDDSKRITLSNPSSRRVSAR